MRLLLYTVWILSAARIGSGMFGDRIAIVSRADEILSIGSIHITSATLQ
jgi:hypothetical protein